MSARAVAGGESLFLGTNGKSAVTAPAPFVKSAAKAGGDEATKERARLAKIGRYTLQRQAQKLLPGYRGLASCGRNVAYREMAPGVDVYLDKATGKAHFANLMTCKSVWACPVCAHRVTEERRADLQTAVALHAMKGGKMLLMSLTFPHERNDDLKGMLKGLSKALNKVTAMSRFRRLLKSVGWIGSVRALEVTHGENGWHPHAHLLLFVGPHEDAVDVVAQAHDLWAKAVHDAGLGHINEHGFDVRGGDYAAEYVTKFGKEPTQAGWTAAHELTKSPVKKGRQKASRTPFQILEDSMNGDDQAGALFVEYVNAFKGKRQLFWSRGLRKKLGMGAEKSDEEILAEAEALEARKAETELTGTLNGDDWGLVLANNARGQVLAAAERGGWPGVRQLLEELKGRRPTDSGAFWWEGVLVKYHQDGMKPIGMMRTPG